MKTVVLTFMFAVGLTAVLFLARASFGEDMTVIAANGKAECVVVVVDDAAAPEKHAAEELGSFLEQITGVRFEIVSDYSGLQGRLLVGVGAAKLADPDLSTEGLGLEGIVIRTVGRDVIIAGGRPRGTLYAVYTLLEDVIGCRWWTPTVSMIPNKPELEIPKLNIRYVPPLEYREPYWGGWVDAAWAARMKHNGGRTELSAKYGGKIMDTGPCHSFEHYLPPDKYFEEHPEWYSEVDGKRVGNRSQLCMTNQEMTQEFIKNVKADVRAHYPGTSWVWVSQNDWTRYCECAECKKVNDREESLAGTNIYFANAVGDAVAAEFPGVSVMTFAYDWSQKPPKYAKVSPNVIVEICTTGCSYSQPYTHEQNRQFKERIEDWARIADRIYIWDYLVNFASYICPHPNLRTLGPNVRFFAANNVTGIFGQGAWGAATGTEFAELRRWVLCKLYWDPTLDSEKLIDEFLAGYFRAAAEHLRKYIDVFHDASNASGATLGMTETVFPDNYLSFETMCDCLEHLRAAEAAVANDADLAGRVEIAKLPVLYVFLMRWDEFQDRAKATNTKWPLNKKIKPVYDHFVSVMTKNDIKEISEKNARGQWPSVKERVEQGPPLVPPGCEGLPRSTWADLQNGGFSIKSPPAPAIPWVVLVNKDEAASNGSAARMRGDHGAKALNQQLWRVPLVAAAAQVGKKLHCRISVRCELTGREGVAFRCGVDGKDRDLVVNCADVPNDGYNTYDLGVFDSLSGWIHLWASPGDNPDNVTAVWVDRAWLVTED